MSHLFMELGATLAVVYAGGRAVEAIGKPHFLGEIGAGILVGPAVLDLVSPTGAVHVFASIGAASLFFHVGYADVDVGGLLRVGRSSLAVAAFGMIIPFVAGIGTGLAFGYPPAGTMFLALALSITSIAITVRTLDHLGAAETTLADKLVGAAIVDDVAGMIAFSVLLLGTAGATSLTGGSVGWLLVRVAGFFAVAAVVHFFVADLLFARVPASDRSEGVFLVFGALLTLFAAAAEFAELHAAFGAFVAGLVAGHGDRAADQEYEQGVSAITFGVFAPVFFATIGMRLEFEAMTAVDPLLIVIPVVGIGTKIVGGYLGNRLVGGSTAESAMVGVGMVPRTGVELVIVSVAFTRDFVDQQIYGAFVGLVVVSVLLTPLLLERVGGDRLTECDSAHTDSDPDT